MSLWRRHLRKVAAHRLRDPGVRVRDDELDARETARDELGQKVAPRLLGLLRAGGHGEQLAVTVQADPVRDERRDVLHLPSPARVEERYVEEQVRDRVGDRSLS
jgi:hypothetical protein